MVMMQNEAERVRENVEAGASYKNNDVSHRTKPTECTKMEPISGLKSKETTEEDLMSSHR